MIKSLIIGKTANSDLYMTLHAEELYRQKSHLELNKLEDNDLINDSISNKSLSGWVSSQSISVATITFIKNNVINYKFKDLVISLRNVEDLSDPVIAELNQLCKNLRNKHHNLLLIHVRLELANKFKKLYNETKIKKIYHTENYDKYKIIDTEYKLDFCNISFYKTKNHTCHDKFNNAIKQYLRNEIKNITEVNTEDEEKSKSSPSIKINKYVNIKRAIDETFSVFHLVYLLAERIRNKISNQDYCLFFYTLNGAFISSLLSYILGIDVHYVDHLGPINKLYTVSKEHNIKSDIDYYIISDVICMGTELHRAKNYLETLGCDYKGWFTLVNIGLIDKRDVGNGIEVYNVLEDKNRIKYSVNTRFCEYCFVE